MTDFGTNVQYRSVRPKSDRKAVRRLRTKGHQYLVALRHDADSAIVAETGTLTSSIVGYLGFKTTTTNGVLMPNLLVAEAVVDPTIDDIDADAVFLGMLRRVYKGFDMEKRGYLIAKVDAADERTRRLLEVDGWAATSHRSDRSWVPYVWFAFDWFHPKIEID